MFFGFDSLAYWSLCAALCWTAFLLCVSGKGHAVDSLD
jgi:hypothetical protein